MSAPNDDDPWNETPRCIYCGHQLNYDSPVVEVTFGEFVVGNKSRLHYYNPFDTFPDGESSKFLHLHCLLTLVDFTSARDKESDFTCALCAEQLTTEPEVYRLRIGKMRDTGDEDFWVFDDAEKNAAFLCTDCMLEGLGEGDHSTGCVMLGMA